MNFSHLEKELANNDAASGLGAIGGLLAFALFVWACLYPLSAVITLVTWFTIQAVLSQFCQGLHGFNLILVLYIIPTVAALFVLWPSSRLDHILALNTKYRVIRHVVRLGLFATVILFTHFWIQEDSLWRFSFSNYVWNHLFSDPIRIGLAGAGIVVGHFCLWHWQSLRRNWISLLESMRLCPRGLTLPEQPF